MRIALSGPSRHAVLVAAAGALVFSVLRNAGAATPSGVEQRIDRICNDIPPAVIIEEEHPRDTTLSALMARLHVPGVSIAVIHDGRLAWARGFGVRDARGNPVTTTTRFQAGSISKPITALAALRLVDSGKIDPDADVNEYLKSWKVPDGQFAVIQKVTLRELLSHTAGVNVPGFSGYSAGDPLPSLRRQSGSPSSIVAARMEGANATSVIEEMGAITSRFEFQKPAAGGETALRQLLEELATGSTRYRGVTPDFAEYLKSIVPNNRHLFEALGSVVSITFLHVRPAGMDTYHIVFRNGQGDMDLSLSAAEKVQYAQYFPG